MLAYDTGRYNPYGNFPLFQCGPVDSAPSCKQSGWETDPQLNRGQFCQFEIRKVDQSQSCLYFKGYYLDEVLMEFDTCSPEYFARHRESEEKWIDIAEIVMQYYKPAEAEEGSEVVVPTDENKRV